MTPPTPPPISFAIELKLGWNLISVPFVNTSYKASTLGLSKGDYIISWDATKQGYGKSFIVGILPISMDFSIMPGQGYWVWTATPKTIVLSEA